MARARGIVQLELDIENTMLPLLEEIKKRLQESAKNAEIYAKNLVLKDIVVAIKYAMDLRNLEYRENVSQKWKRWEEEEIAQIIVTLHNAYTLIEDGRRGPPLGKVIGDVGKAITILKKIKKYELRIS